MLSERETGAIETIAKLFVMWPPTWQDDDPEAVAYEISLAMTWVALRRELAAQAEALTTMQIELMHCQNVAGEPGTYWRERYELAMADVGQAQAEVAARDADCAAMRGQLMQLDTLQHDLCTNNDEDDALYKQIGECIATALSGIAGQALLDRLERLEAGLRRQQGRTRNLCHYSADKACNECAWLGCEWYQMEAALASTEPREEVTGG